VRRRLLVPLVLLGLVVAGVVGTATYAAFSSTTANPGDSFAAGTVYLTDNDSNARMLSLTGAKPGDSVTSCIGVTYGGTLQAAVHLYSPNVSGSIASYVNLTVTRGSGAAGFGNCTGFTSTGTGDGQIYSGTLAAFPSTYGTGIVDPQNWSNGSAHVYKFVATLSASAPAAAQATSGSADFTWEARNT
jgi:hypothetical protein